MDLTVEQFLAIEAQRQAERDEIEQGREEMQQWRADRMREESAKESLDDDLLRHISNIDNKYAIRKLLKGNFETRFINSICESYELCEEKGWDFKLTEKQRGVMIGIVTGNAREAFPEEIRKRVRDTYAPVETDAGKAVREMRERKMRAMGI